MLILCDMDGVLADWEAGHNQRILELDPTFPVLAIEDRRGFFSEEQYPEHLRALTLDAMRSPKMYRELEPIDNAITALHEMAQEHTVFLCSTPQDNHATCASDKIDWVRTHLGASWTKKLILTHDKTLVHGDILIDDRVGIRGVQTPAWQHIIFDQPYNREVDPDLPRMNGWLDWRDALKRTEYWHTSSDRTLS